MGGNLLLFQYKIAGKVNTIDGRWYIANNCYSAMPSISLVSTFNWWLRQNSDVSKLNSSQRRCFNKLMDKIK